MSLLLPAPRVYVPLVMCMSDMQPAPKGSMERKARMEGRLGQGIMVLANHFRVALDPSRLKLNRYSVTFNPVTTSVAMLLPGGWGLTDCACTSREFQTCACGCTHLFGSCACVLHRHDCVTSVLPHIHTPGAC